MLTDPIKLSRKHVSHKKIKRTPWNIKYMVKTIIDFENISNNRDPNIEKELLYFQYTYLCAIKHGNPYTISYLNRIEKNEQDSDVISIHPNRTTNDRDLVNWILLLSTTTAFDALIKFAFTFCSQEKYDELVIIKKNISNIIIKDIKLEVPKIAMMDSEEYKEDFLKYLNMLDQKIRQNNQVDDINEEISEKSK